VRVIGVGFGRTGTASLKVALERLGTGPCHHMLDVMQDHALTRAWLATAESQHPDWSALFAGYSSTVDWPAAAFWRELLEAYPRAKAILTVRDPQRWYDSMEKTILRAWRQRRERAGNAPVPGTGAAGRATDMADFGKLTEAVVSRRVFGGKGEDRDHAIATFQRHTAEVRATVAPDRLLVYEVTQGWAPLCAFLDVPEPDEPFPWENDSATFVQRADAIR
jgi:Sulfotransferase domain